MAFGASFREVSSISNPLLKPRIIDSSSKVSDFIKELTNEVGTANREFLGLYTNLDSYNASSQEMPKPYHFVFINDFPDGFSQQSVDDLRRIIDKKNACKAGVKIFINYSADNPHPRDFDIQHFKSLCSCIKSKGNNIELINWQMDLGPHLSFELETSRSPLIEDYIRTFNNTKQKEVTFSLDKWVKEQMETGLVWTGDTSDGINVPIGFKSPTQIFNFYMANDRDNSCNDFFALIAGRPGYGKTTMLQNIITHSAIRYSPEDLWLYLADFAQGASFSIYRNLPHVKSLMLKNSREYALRMLEDIILKAKERARLYQEAVKTYGRQVDNLTKYRELTGQKLPRIIFAMDEFHELFSSIDETSIAAKEILCNGIKGWRKFGISVILSTQSISGVNFGDADTQITYRFALNLLGQDSKTVIRNDCAKSLTRKGQTIMNNTADGNVEMNVEFQGAYSPHHIEYVNYLADLYESRYGSKHRPYICDSNIDIDIAENEDFVKLLTSPDCKVNNNNCDVHIGKPDLLRNSHTRIRYRRQQNSNTLIIGDDYKTLVSTVMSQLLQIYIQSDNNSKFYIMDCFNAGDEYKGLFNGISEELSDRFIVGETANMSYYINEIHEELERRKALQLEGRMADERIILTIMNIQNCYDLRPSKPFQPSVASSKLASIITDGAPMGIHCIIHGLTYDTVFNSTKTLSNGQDSSFENQILLKGADVERMCPIKRISPVSEEGEMIVINAKLDGKNYELCYSYSELTLDAYDNITGYMNSMYKKLNPNYKN